MFALSDAPVPNVPISGWPAGLGDRNAANQNLVFAKQMLGTPAPFDPGRVARTKVENAKQKDQPEQYGRLPDRRFNNIMHSTRKPISDATDGRNFPPFTAFRFCPEVNQHHNRRQ